MTIGKQYQELLDQFPFLTLASYGNNEYVGIMQNQDNNVISMYVYDQIKSNNAKKVFLDLGGEWWWETNRKLPINIALLNRWNFQYCVQSFNVKQMDVIAGPEVRLSNSITKRIKRRSINLVKKNQ